MAGNSKKLSEEQIKSLIGTLKKRFERNPARHQGIQWTEVESRLEKAQPSTLWSLFAMDESGGEPDVIGKDNTTGELIFVDCSEESPKGRRSICYDGEALEARKENKPADSAIEMANEMGITILNEEQYRALQRLGTFDAKTSSWILTPTNIRALGGALFADYRYGTVFVYHNGAQSYYAARGFRGMLKV